jgi:hypothetical protein
MDYCTQEPLVGGAWRTSLSGGDIFGARNVYGRNTSAHGFMIYSTNAANGYLAVNAWGGARQWGPVKLANSCSNTNPDCTWSYQYGMLVSDRDPTLAISAQYGVEQTDLVLDRSCTQTIVPPSYCTWTWTKGQFVSDVSPNMGMNAWGGARNGDQLKITSLCNASNPDCTWLMPYVMLSNARDNALAINSFGGAQQLTQLKVNHYCTANNTDCTFSFSGGMIYSGSFFSGLPINAFGGANNGTIVALNNQCTPSNPDCTWTWSHGELISDNTANGIQPMTAWGGTVYSTYAPIRLGGACTASNADCVFNGLFAQP